MDLDSVDILVFAETEDEVLAEELSKGLFEPKLADKAPVSAAGNLLRFKLFPSQVLVSFCLEGVAAVLVVTAVLPSSFSLLLALSLSLIARVLEELDSEPTSFNFLFGLPNSH